MDNYWEALSRSWVGLASSMHMDEKSLFIICLLSTEWLVFYGLNGMLALCYAFSLFPKHRIQGQRLPEPAIMWKALWHAMLGHFIIHPPLLWYAMYDVFKWSGVCVRCPLPHPATVASQLLVCLLVNETCFYFAHRFASHAYSCYCRAHARHRLAIHRLLHHPVLYKHIHKQHHLFKTNIGLAALYAHPIEDVIANLLPTLLGPILCGSHVLVLCLWTGFRLAETIDAHSGYHFPFSLFTIIGSITRTSSSRRHDFHHSHNMGNFGGMIPFWDWVFGTDKDYRKWLENSKVARQL